jgi:adenosylhomocysteine nucleosidase
MRWGDKLVSSLSRGGFLLMCIGIIGATENEVNPFITAMRYIQTEKYAMLEFNRGKYANTDVIALYCGVCKVNAAIATQILIDRYKVEKIIVIGVAGAISSELHIADTVISSEIAYHDVADEVLTQYHPWMKSIYFAADWNLISNIVNASPDDDTLRVGRVVTGEAFIDKDGREEIIEKYKPLCVDMETASVAHVCHVNSIPFVAIRTICDTPHESGSNNARKHIEAAAEKSVRVLIQYLDADGASINMKETKSHE